METSGVENSAVAEIYCWVVAFELDDSATDNVSRASASSTSIRSLGNNYVVSGLMIQHNVIAFAISIFSFMREFHPRNYINVFTHAQDSTHPKDAYHNNWNSPIFITTFLILEKISTVFYKSKNVFNNNDNFMVAWKIKKLALINTLFGDSVSLQTKNKFSLAYIDR